MKKIVLAAALVFTSFGSSVLAQGAGTVPEVDLMVVNISQDNQDALKVGARVGDVLRYEVAVHSQANNAMGFETRVDVSQVLKAAEIIDPGLGGLDGSDLAFPVFTQVAPYEKNFSFFARISKECGGLNVLETTAHGVSKKVDLACGLAESGPGLGFAFLIVFMLSGVMVWHFRGSRV